MSQQRKPGSLLPPNATQFEYDIATLFSRLSDLPVNVFDVWNPDTCPTRFLPWLAWAMSVDSWQEYWGEERKRQRIKDAVSQQRLKGTRQSIQTVLDSYGDHFTIEPWFEMTPTGAPGTFRVFYNADQFDHQSDDPQADPLADMVRDIRNAKSARDHFTLESRRHLNTDVSTTAGASVATLHRIAVTTDIPGTSVSTYGLGRVATFTHLEATAT